MRVTWWTDEVRTDKFADPVQALTDIREAHAWATQELATADGIRHWNLDQERKRLATLYRKVERGVR